VSAGHGEYTGIEVVKRQLQIPQIWLPENGQLGLVRVEGDSMFPTINNGDYVAVEFSSGYTADGLYLIRVDDTAFVKRLQRKFGGIKIISDNPQYEEMQISHDDGNEFALIGRVTLIVRKT
jgi:phage repressor protein C with HTH and peptisase S24 domain